MRCGSDAEFDRLGSLGRRRIVWTDVMGESAGPQRELLGTVGRLQFLGGAQW
jgi:hypothetical protein